MVNNPNDSGSRKKPNSLDSIDESSYVTAVERVSEIASQESMEYRSKKFAYTENTAAAHSVVDYMRSPLGQHKIGRASCRERV